MEEPMCRNIRTLFNFEPPATDEEIRASALQFVRKLSGFAHPSRANEAAFARAVDEVTDAARRLLQSLETASPATARRKRRKRVKGRRSDLRNADQTNALLRLDAGRLDDRPPCIGFGLVIGRKRCRRLLLAR